MNINDFKNGWYGSLEDLVQELIDEEFDVIDQNHEFISVWDNGTWVAPNGVEVQHVLHLGGTERTIIVTKIETYIV